MMKKKFAAFKPVPSDKDFGILIGLSDDGASASFHEHYSQMNFTQTTTRVLAAIMGVNRLIMQEKRCTLNQYFELLGIPKARWADGWGWDADYIWEQLGDCMWLDFDIKQINNHDGYGDLYSIECFLPPINLNCDRDRW